MVNNDINPSVFGIFFGKPETIFEAIKEINSTGGMRVRIALPVDISMPLDERTEENINFLKSFSNPMLKRFVDTDFPFRNILEKQIKKQGLEIMKYQPWKTRSQHKLLWSGFTPVAVDEKYRDKYTAEENKILDKLIKFESNYKDDETLLKEQIDKELGE